MAVFTDVGSLHSYLFFSLFYLFVIAAFVFPPDEFILAGVTIECLFDSWLGSENVDFIKYHIRRTSLTVILHSLLPLGYVGGLSFINSSHTGKYDYALSQEYGYLWIGAFSVTLIIPTVAFWRVWDWSYNDWEKHPIAKQLSVFASPNTSWTSVAAEINNEYRRLNKVNLRLSSIVRVIATNHWIMKVSPYTVNMASQSGTTLTVKSADMHKMTTTAIEEVQFVNIEVNPSRQGVEPFTIRLNVLDLKDFQDRVARPINIPQNIRLHQSLTDRFLDTFSREVSLNPVFETDEEIEPCIGCMQVPANVKLQKLCTNTLDSTSDCTICYCKPTWCIDCMGRWFASRQEGAPQTWLSSKCTCPLCRAKFCILDVSKVVQLSR